MENSINNDRIYMKEAIAEAEHAALFGEVPIGCVIVYDGEIIARAGNGRESEKNALRHAELTAIDRACERRGGWRLFGCTLYVTLEPCPMCAGAIMNSRISRVVYGAKDPKAGAYESVLNLNSFSVNHKPEVTSGVMEEECSSLLRSFFARLRDIRREEKENDAPRKWKRQPK